MKACVETEPRTQLEGNTVFHPKIQCLLVGIGPIEKKGDEGKDIESSFQKRNGDDHGGIDHLDLLLRLCVKGPDARTECEATYHCFR